MVANRWLIAGACVMASANAFAQQTMSRPTERSVIRSRNGGASSGGPALPAGPGYAGVPGNAPGNSPGNSSGTAGVPGAGSGAWSRAGSATRSAPVVPPTRMPAARVPPSRAGTATATRVYQGPMGSRVSGPVNRSEASASGPVATGPMNSGSPRREAALPDAPPEEVFPGEDNFESHVGPPVPPGYVVEMDGPQSAGAGPYEEYVEEEVYSDGPYVSDGWTNGPLRRGYGWGGHHGHGHGMYADDGGVGYPDYWFGGHGLLQGLRIRGEFLRWQSSGMHVPALVATNSGPTPPRTQAGVVGSQGFQVLYGDGEILDDAVSGGRFYAGLPLDYDHRLVLEGEYFSLEEAAESFDQSSGGTPILARPFFNLLTSPNNVPAESSELIAYPGVVRGEVGVVASSTFQGAAARLRYLLCCSEGCLPSLSGRHPDVPGGYRMELTGGYRYLKLQDHLRISENLTSTTPAGTFELFDDFATDNQFHGVELGMLLQTRRGRWTMDWVSRLGIGSTDATSTIAGETSINNAPAVSGALLAQTSNIGSFDTSDFALTPELGLSLGFDLTPRFRLVAGYSMIYWSRVLRAGEQIDREINPNLIPPPEGALIGPQRPGQTFVWSDYWAQGVSVGVEGHW